MIPKFRAWDSAKQEMFTDTFAITESGQVVVVDQSSVFVSPDYVFVDNLVIMQSTGLYDKNGREIFEGDIVKRYRSPFFKAEWEYLIETVVREGASLLLGRDFGKNFGTLPFDSPFAKGDLLEVIGNVHENPELLEVEE
nr:MAG TPA: YopX protein [Caudoviricetes sp.]